MSEDYFDDASDADFLALAQQLDNRGTGSTVRNASSTSGATLSNTPRTPASGSTSTRPPETTRPETSKANQSAPRVLRPGFNAIIVNTRQVNYFDLGD